MNKPLLSICIPTYNRAEYLKQSLDSLVIQNKFEEIEVVISDNCSTDNTEEVAKSFCSKYLNIRYFKNEENIRDKNFPTALLRASGIFRKLSNDTIIYKQDSLKYIIEIVQFNMSERLPIFFMNGNSNMASESLICNNLNEFVYGTSYFSTWIGGFGLWEDDCNKLENEYELCDTQLWQTYKLFSCVEKKKKAFLSNKIVFDMIYLKKKDISYGLVKVFYYNYFDLLCSYLKTGEISNDCFNWLKKEILFGFFSKWIVDLELKKDCFEAENEKLRASIIRIYKDEPYFKEYQKHLKKCFMKEKRSIKIQSLKSKFSSFFLFQVLLFLKRRLNIKLY